VKTTLILVLAGALLGVAVASVVVPPALSWYSAPGGLPQGTEIRALVQIPEVIQYATGKLIYGQAVGAGIGAVVGLIVGMVAAFKRRPVQTVPPAAPGPTPTH
jgi:hypothetical protein